MLVPQILHFKYFYCAPYFIPYKLFYKNSIQNTFINLRAINVRVIYTKSHHLNRKKQLQRNILILLLVVKWKIGAKKQRTIKKMIGQVNDTESVFVWQNNTTSYFPVSLKFGACYMMGQGGFQNKNSTLCCHLKFEHSLSSNEFFRYMFCCEKNVYTAENDQIHYFVQIWVAKIIFLSV